MNEIQEYIIVQTVWKHSIMNGHGSIGVVAIKTGVTDNQWKAYIGYIAVPTTEELDVYNICKWGAKMLENEARGYFPQLDKMEYVD